MGLSLEVTDTLALFSWQRATLWFSYIIAYGATAYLVLRHSKLAVPVAIFAVGTDLFYWALAADTALSFTLDRLFEFNVGIYGLRDMVFNLLAVLIAAGVLALRQTGQLR
jgi:hypothetical protein